MKDSPQRSTLHVECATITFQQAYPGNQFHCRLYAPRIARRAVPGSFVHVTCNPLRPMRRPLSILRVDAEEGWIELLYRVVGEGTALLAERRGGESLSLLGPVGNGFRPDTSHGARPLLIGGGVGMPPMLFLADRLRHHPGVEALALLGSETGFPFSPTRSALPVAGLDPAIDATAPLLEEWGVAGRLTSQNGGDGIYRGWVTGLAQQWLEALPETERSRVTLYACGPHPMLEACAALARQFGLPCQVSLEEFMACAVGGCAGCTVEVTLADGGKAMRRVCVDGPVFDAEAVFG